MAEEPLDLQALARRLAKLESHNRRRKQLGLFLLIIVFTGGFTVVTPPPPKIIMAENFSLVDKNGITRMKMELENEIPQITLAFDNGDPCLRISGGELCFYDKGKKIRVNIMAKNTLDTSSLSITDKDGKNCVTLSAGPEGPYLSFDDNGEKKEVVLSIDPIGTLNGIESSSGKR